MRRYLSQAVAVSLSLLALPLVAHGDPVRFSLKTPVPQPDQPTLIIVADQALTGLSVAIVAKEPDPALGAASGESGESKFQAKKLGAGQKTTFKLGTGKVGATHWEGMISAQVGGQEMCIRDRKRACHRYFWACATRWRSTSACLARPATRPPTRRTSSGS